MSPVKPHKHKVQQDWNRRGFSFGIFTDPPGRCWEDYVHGEDELFMVEGSYPWTRRFPVVLWL